MRGHAGLGLELQLGGGPAAEVDRGARERVVHRHDGVAVARDPAPVAERAVERLAERERGVLDRVVVAGLEVARALEHEVEAGVEGELLEEVVVDARRRSRRARGSRRRGASRTAIRVSAVARRWRTRRPPPRATGAGRSSTRASVSTSRSSSSRSRIVIRIAVGERADDEPAPQQRVAERRRASSTGTKRKFAVRRQRLEPERAQRRGEPLALLDHAGVTSGGDASAASASAREARHRRRRLAAVQLGGESRDGDRVADARAREPERLRERAQHDDAVVDQRDRRLAGVLEVRLVDDERPRVRQRPSSPVGLFGRQANVSTGSSSPTSAPASCAAMR